MSEESLSRRSWLKVPVLFAGAGALGAAGSADPPEDMTTSFRYCLNTSTVRGQRLSIVEEVELAGAAGYDGIEPWIREIQQYQESGGNLSDLKKRIEDAGLKVESAIGFAPWIVDDPQRRAAALEEMKRDMDLVRQIGGTRIAAPPAGATEQADLDLLQAAQRYRDVLELGRQMGVVPQLELWGFSQSLHRIGELVFVASEAAHEDACLLPDVYHIYKGGSDFQGLNLISGQSIHVFHMNDYPATPPRETIRDSDRVYPGDGIAPLSSILKILYANGFRGALSLELFNEKYWAQDARQVTQTGLDKMRQAVQQAAAG